MGVACRLRATALAYTFLFFLFCGAADYLYLFVEYTHFSILTFSFAS